MQGWVEVGYGENTIWYEDVWMATNLMEFATLIYKTLKLLKS